MNSLGVPLNEYRQIEFQGTTYEVDEVISALDPQLTDRRQKRIQTVLAYRLTSIAVGLEDLHHSPNAAACLRTAEAVGIHDIVAVELREAYPLPEMSHDPAQSRVNMYANRWVDLHRVGHTEEMVEWARARDMRIIGTSPHASMWTFACPILALSECP